MIRVGLGMGLGGASSSTTSAISASNVLFSDTFERADTTAGFGIAETGQPWQYYGGSTYGITSGSAYTITGTGDDNFAGYDTLTESNVEIEIVFSRLGGEQWRSYAVLRASAPNSYILVQAETDRYVMWDHTGGGFVSFSPAYMVVPVPGDRLNIIANGPNITTKLNDVVIMSGVCNSNLTKTTHGFHSRSNGWANSAVGSFKIMKI